MRLAYIILIAIFFQTNSYAQSIEKMIDSKPIAFSGSIGASVSYYAVDNIDNRLPMLNYGLSARLTTSIYGIDIPIFVSYRDNSFNYSGPYNRFRISPSYKWAKAQIGDVYMNFNPYVLSGRTVKGYGLSTTPGKFRFHALYGKLEDLKSYTDTLVLGTTREQSYTRKVAGFSIGVGSASSHIDVMATKSWDIQDSLLRTIGATPKSNLVLGSNIKFRLFKRFYFETKAGYSFLTNNLDTYGENTVVGQNNLTGNLFEYNLSSGRAYAGEAGLRYRGKRFGLFVKSQYVQPYYRALTIAYMNTDFFNNTFGGNFNLFKSKLSVRAQVGIQSNNLTKAKSSTTNHVIFNTSARWRPSKKLSVGVLYHNFNQDFQTSLVQIGEEITYAVQSANLRANLNYKIPVGANHISIGLAAGQSQFETITDNNEASGDFFNSLNYSLNSGYTLKSQDLRIHLSVFNTDMESQRRPNTVRRGISIRTSKGFMKKRLGIHLRSSFVQTQRKGLREADTWLSNLSLSYKLQDDIHATCNVSYAQRNAAIRSDFSEWRSSLQVNYKF